MTPHHFQLSPAVRQQLRRAQLVEEDVIGILASQPLTPQPQQSQPQQNQSQQNQPQHVGFYLPLPVRRESQFLALAWTEAVMTPTEDGGYLVVELRISPHAGGLATD